VQTFKCDNHVEYRNHVVLYILLVYMSSNTVADKTFLAENLFSLYIIVDNNIKYIESLAAILFFFFFFDNLISYDFKKPK